MSNMIIAHNMLETDLSDAALVAATLAGDRDAFGLIVTRYQSLVCSLAFSATGSLTPELLTCSQHYRSVLPRRFGLFTGFEARQGAQPKLSAFLNAGCSTHPERCQTQRSVYRQKADILLDVYVRSSGFYDRAHAPSAFIG